MSENVFKNIYESINIYKFLVHLMDKFIKVPSNLPSNCPLKQTEKTLMCNVIELIYKHIYLLS